MNMESLDVLQDLMIQALVKMDSIIEEEILAGYQRQAVEYILPQTVLAQLEANLLPLEVPVQQLEVVALEVLPPEDLAVLQLQGEVQVAIAGEVINK